MTGTRGKLLDAAAQSLRVDGLATLSARSLAARAGVNQALVFYHFGTLDGLLTAAVRQSVDDSADFYRDRFAAVTSLGELLNVGRELHERERAAGNVAMMAQLMSGAGRNPALAEAARYAMSRWNREIEAVVRRVLRGHPLQDALDPAGTARAISAGFIGLELYEGVDPDGAASALEVLDRLGALVDIFDDLGPVVRRAVQTRLRSRLRSARAGGTAPVS
jgi:AcrR family transcriptional regulator